MSRSGRDGDNPAMESFFSSVKADCIARKAYWTRDEAKADWFDCIETLALDDRISKSLEFEMQAGLA